MILLEISFQIRARSAGPYDWNGLGEVNAPEQHLCVQHHHVHHFFYFVLVVRENQLVKELNTINQLLGLVDNLDPAVVVLSKITGVLLHLVLVILLEVADVLFDDFFEWPCFVH